MWAAKFNTFKGWKHVLTMLATATEVFSKVVTTTFKANYDFNSFCM